MPPSNVNSLVSQGAKKYEEIKETIVDAFAERAKAEGIRAIKMSLIAQDLGMSKKTFYKYFSSKDDVVKQLVVRWEMRFKRPVAVVKQNIVAQLAFWVDRWLDVDAQYSHEFWSDLACDYPILYQQYRQALLARMATMRRFLRPYLREGMDCEYTWHTYRVLMKQAAEPTTCDTLGLSQQESVHKALKFWVTAALDPKKINR